MILAILSVAVSFSASPKLEKQVAAPAPPPQRLIVAPQLEAAPLLSVAVTLECTARASGKVENCQVLGETHPGMGFAEAAVALMREATVGPGPQDFQFARTIQFTP
nr:hypothetical protein [Brevundimonas naejangsanensis]